MELETIFKFSIKSDISNWRNTDDVVMGGKSKGDFYLNDKGHGVFKGSVSLENNGGFCSVKCALSKIDTSQYSKIILKVRGDNKKYQFRIKTKKSDRHAYVSHFYATNNWQNIELELKNMYPTFRGKQLDMQNYNHEGIEEVAFLFGNKKAENFQLEIDCISLK